MTQGPDQGRWGAPEPGWYQPPPEPTAQPPYTAPWPPGQGQPTGWAAAPPGYPTGYPVPPGYHGYPAYPAGPQRPGAATAVGVLGIVQGSGNLLNGIFLLAAGTTLVKWSDYTLTDTLGAELTVVSLAILLSGVGLLVGGIQVLGGRRTVLLASAVFSLLISAYFMLRTELTPEFIAWPLLYAVMPVIILALGLSASVTAWTRLRRA